MRLDELNKTIIDKNAFDLPTNYLKQHSVLDYVGREELDIKLDEAGWNKINSGSYSSTYSYPGKQYILKINTKYDPAFAYFTLLTKKFPNKHFPNIGNMKLIINKSPKNSSIKKYYLYLIEKLNPIQESLKYDHLRWALKNKAMYHSNYSIKEYKEKYPTSEVTLILNTVPESLVNAADIIGKYKKSNMFLDFHEENFMKRDDGTIVIIDPYALRMT